MLIGSTLWYGKNIIKKIKLTKRLGFDYIEIYLDYPLPEGFTSKELEYLETSDIKIAFHAPVELNLACPIKEISYVGLKTIKKLIKFSNRFSPIYFNLHITSDVATLNFEKVRRDAIKTGLTNIKKIKNFANRYNIKIVIENNNVPFFGTIEDFEKLCKVKNTEFCFDLGHFIKSEWLANKKNVNALDATSNWFRKFRDKTKVAHLYDIIYSKSQPPQNHISLGYGQLNLNEIVKTVKQANIEYITLEIMGKKKKGDKISKELLAENLKIIRSLCL